MRILTRYLLRLHIGPFVFSLAALVMLLLLNELSKKFEQLVGKGLHPSVIAEVFLYSIPWILAQTLPMAVLIAVLYTFNRLASDNEITAMRASGIAMPRLVAPLLVAAGLLAGGMVWFNDEVLPASNHRLAVLLTSIGRKMPTFELHEQTLNEVLPSRLYIQVGSIDHRRSELEDVAIYDERLANRSRTIYADSARMAYSPDQTDLYLTLHGGVMQEQDIEEPSDFHRVRFSRLVMRVADVSNQLELQGLGGWRSDREMRIREMREKVEEARAEAVELQREARAYTLALTHRHLGRRPPPATETADSLVTDSAARLASREQAPRQVAAQFRTFSRQIVRARGQANQFSVEIQKKYSIPAACIVFVLIGAPVAIRYPLGGVALVVAVSIVVFCAYYVALVGGEELADRLILSPFWAMWSPNVLFGAGGLALLWRARRAGR